MAAVLISLPLLLLLPLFRKSLLPPLDVYAFAPAAAPLLPRLAAPALTLAVSEALPAVAPDTPITHAVPIAPLAHVADLAAHAMKGAPATYERT